MADDATEAMPDVEGKLKVIFQKWEDEAAQEARAKNAAYERQRRAKIKETDPERYEKIKATRRVNNKRSYDKTMADPEAREKLKEQRREYRKGYDPKVKASPEKMKKKRDQQNTMYRQNWQRRQSNYIAAAKKRGLEWCLTPEETKALFEDGACHYCFRNRADLGQLLGIDRKDSNVGYLTGNAVPCCANCNYAKLDWPYDEFLSWLDVVVKARAPLLLKQQ